MALLWGPSTGSTGREVVLVLMDTRAVGAVAAAAAVVVLERVRRRELIHGSVRPRLTLLSVNADGSDGSVRSVASLSFLDCAGWRRLHTQSNKLTQQTDLVGAI